MHSSFFGAKGKLEED